MRNRIKPRWMTFQDAAKYCGMCVGTLQNYEKAGLLRVANVIQPGSTRGRKLIDIENLDAFIEGHIGTVTQCAICPTDNIG